MYEETPVLTQDEIERILAQIDTRYPSSARDACLIQLLAQTGLRIGEALAIELPDIRRETWTIENVPQDVTVLRPRTETTKGKRPRQAIPLTHATREALATWMDHRSKLRIRGPHLFCTVSRGRGCKPAGKIGDGNTVPYTHQPGKQISPQQFRDKLSKLARDAGIERRVHPHMLRHTCLTALYERTHDIRLVQDVAGHRSIATTQRYTHVRPDAVAIAMGAVDGGGVGSGVRGEGTTAGEDVTPQAAPGACPTQGPDVDALAAALSELPPEARAALAALIALDTRGAQGAERRVG